MSSTSGFQRMVQYFWDKDLENTDPDTPIVVLGRQYSIDTQRLIPQDHPTSDQTEEENTTDETPLGELKNYFSSLSFNNNTKKKDIAEWPPEFLDDVYTRLWFTYRTKFPPLQKDPDGPSPISLNAILRAQNYELNGDYFTTDCGWGCMIRTGQTLLANTFLELRLGRDWRFDGSSISDEHNEIVSWFVDKPESPFSIHNFVDKGRLLAGKKAGEWFGPSAAARSIQALCNGFGSAGLNVYIGSDSGDIYEQDLFKNSKTKDGVFQPTLILLGVRLGVENVNSIYWQNIKNILSSKESVGISGGRPSSSHYFFGYQGDYLFYLDPHLPQPALKETTNTLEGSVSESTEIVSGTSLDFDSVHTRKLRKLHLSEIDPSMLLGFLIKNEDEWNEWKERVINDKDNKIIHISSDQSISHLFRKPSFVVYDEEGGDFVDVGLEIEELKAEGFDDIPEARAGDVSSDINLVEKSELVSEDYDNDRSVIVLSKDHDIEELVQPEAAAPVDNETFEEFSAPEREEEFENLRSSTSIGLDDSAVEVESIKAEEPFVVDKPEESSVEEEEITEKEEEGEEGEDEDDDEN